MRPLLTFIFHRVLILLRLSFDSCIFAWRPFFLAVHLIIFVPMNVLSQYYVVLIGLWVFVCLAHNSSIVSNN